MTRTAEERAAYQKAWRAANPEKVAAYARSKEYCNAAAKKSYAKNKSPELSTYRTAKARCQNPKHISYAYYGGRGITFEIATFEEFIQEVGPRPPGCSLDRIDNAKGYAIGNIRWATLEEQAANRRARSTCVAENPNIYATKYGRFKVIIKGKYLGCCKTLAEALNLKEQHV